MSDLKSTMSNPPNEINSIKPDMTRNRLPPQHTPDPPYAPVPQQQQRSVPLAQFQPPQPQPPPQSQAPPPQQQQQSHHAEVRMAAGGGTTPARSPAPIRQPSQNIDTNILPSGKPVVKEVTITLSGKLPSHPTDAIPPAADGKRILEEGTARQITTTTVTKQTIEHRVCNLNQKRGIICFKIRKKFDC
jgi:hypothetical protein